MKTPQQMAANWTAGMGSPQAQANYKAGIEAYQGNPMAEAASPAAEQLYLQNVQDSVTSGRRSRKLQSVPVAYWKSQSTSTGAQNLANGARKAAQKVAAFFQRWAPIYAQASAAAHALPKGGKANALNRVSAVLDVLIAAKGT